MVNVGKYTRPMDPMGSVHVPTPLPKTTAPVDTARVQKADGSVGVWSFCLPMEVAVVFRLAI